MKRTPVRILLVVALQVAIMAMLQLSAVLPVLGEYLGHKSMPSVCQGDHSLCGCAPERVAAKNCCCFLRGVGEESSCCGSDEHDTGAGCKEDTSALPSVYSAPCGDGVKFLGYSGTSPDLLLPSAAYRNVRAWRVLVYPPHTPAFAGLTPEPPEPPPKISC